MFRTQIIEVLELNGFLPCLFIDHNLLWAFRSLFEKFRFSFVRFLLSRSSSQRLRYSTWTRFHKWRLQFLAWVINHFKIGLFLSPGICHMIQSVFQLAKLRSGPASFPFFFFGMVPIRRGGVAHTWPRSRLLLSHELWDNVEVVELGHYLWSQVNISVLASLTIFEDWSFSVGMVPQKVMITTASYHNLHLLIWVKLGFSNSGVVHPLLLLKSTLIGHGVGQSTVFAIPRDFSYSWMGLYVCWIIIELAC